MKSSRFPLVKVEHGLVDVKFLTLLAAAVVGMAELLFIVLLAAIGVRALILVVVTMIDASRQLDVHRISKWDSRLEKKNE